MKPKTPLSHGDPHPYTVHGAKNCKAWSLIGTVLGEKIGLAYPVLLLLPTGAARAEILESIWVAEGANKA